jgi:hypothetical protein
MSPRHTVFDTENKKGTSILGKIPTFSENLEKK